MAPSQDKRRSFHFSGKPFDERIEKIKKEHLSTFQVLRFNLTAARNSEPFSHAGSFFYLLRTVNSAGTEVSGSILVSFNRNDQVLSVPLDARQGLKIDFDRFFLTNTAQSGVIAEVLIAEDDAFLFIDQRVGGAASSVTQGTDPWNISIDQTGNNNAVDVLTLPALPAGTNNIGDVDVLTLPALPAGTNNIGDVDVLTLPALPAGTNNIGDVDVLTLPALPAGTNLIGDVQVQAKTSGGWTPYKLNSAATTNATNVKASAGQIGYIQCINTNAAVRYLKIYNKASSPTVGTDTPVQTFPIPGNTAGAGFTLSCFPGMNLSTGISFALTTGAADSDTGAVAANEIIVNLGYL